jgi:hypothetical protein
MAILSVLHQTVGVFKDLLSVRFRALLWYPAMNMGPSIAGSNRADRPILLELECLAHEQYRGVLLIEKPPV